MALTRLISAASTHGPFFVDLPMSALLLSSAPAAHDVSIRLLALLPGAIAERRLAPGSYRVPTGGVVGLAAAVRVVDRVHRHTAALRPLALVAAATGLADLEVLVLGVGEHADCGATVGADQAHLRGRQAQGHHLALLGGELDRSACRAPELAALAGGELDVVDERAGRHVAKRKRVARFDVGAG